MEKRIILKNTDILLKFLNCIERVLFVDNKWMQDYEDLKNNVDKEYKGVSSFLQILLEYFNNKNLSIFTNSLPEKERVSKYNGILDGIILESLNHSLYINEGEEDKQYVVIACPKIERVFHFKVNKPVKEYLLKKAIIKDFYYHPSLPRIKIYSKNLGISEQSCSLSELRFLYTLPEDASMQIKSYKTVNGKIVWDDLVPDPAYGVQVGNLGVYYISPIKIVQIKRDIENLHQLILVAEDWIGKKYEFCIRTSKYREIFKEFPEEKELENPVYLRTLVFQGFAEDFRHIISAEKISIKEFQEDSLLCYIRFRKVVNKNELPKNIDNLSKYVEETEGYLYYFPKGFDTEMFKTAKEFSEGHKLSISFSSLKKYHDFQEICEFHPEWTQIYKEKKEATLFYSPLDIINPNPWGLHRSFIRNPIYKLTFYAKNKRLIIFCSDCKKYKEIIETKNIPERCPVCKSRTLISLDDSEDDKLLINEETVSEEVQKKIKRYYRLSSLFIPFSKNLYYTLNFTKYSLNTCVKILNELKSFFSDESIFFEKLFKTTESYNRSEDIHSIIYKINKNEV